MKRFEHILCGVEPGPPAGMVLERAVSRSQNDQASLAVVPAGIITPVTLD